MDLKSKIILISGPTASEKLDFPDAVGPEIRIILDFKSMVILT